MNKLFAKSAVASVLMAVTLCSWAARPCMPIAMSCMQMGYYKGGEKVGKGLIKDCVFPVVAGTKKLPNTNFSPEQLQKCKMEIAKKMKKKMQH